MTPFEDENASDVLSAMQSDEGLTNLDELILKQSFTLNTPNELSNDIIEEYGLQGIYDVPSNFYQLDEAYHKLHDAYYAACRNQDIGLASIFINELNKVIWRMDYMIIKAHLASMNGYDIDKIENFFIDGEVLEGVDPLAESTTLYSIHYNYEGVSHTELLEYGVGLTVRECYKGQAGTISEVGQCYDLSGALLVCKPSYKKQNMNSCYQEHGYEKNSNAMVFKPDNKVTKSVEATFKHSGKKK